MNIRSTAKLKDAPPGPDGPVQGFWREGGGRTAWPSMHWEQTYFHAPLHVSVGGNSNCKINRDPLLCIPAALLPSLTLFSVGLRNILHNENEGAL